MNTLDGMIQWLIINYAREAILLSACMLCIVLQSFLVTGAVNRRWKKHIKFFLPEIAREELAEREDTIRRLSARVEELKEEKQILVNVVRGSAAFMDQAREMLTQPEVIRLRRKNDAG